MSNDVVCIDLNDGNKIPAIGYGTWEATGAVLEKALNTALEIGYRHIDTATIYLNEANIGKVLRKWLSSGKLKREEIFVTTKLPFHACRPHSVPKYLRKSLSDLKLDYVDMYLIHGPWGFAESDDLYPKDEDGKLKYDFGTDHIATWKAMEEQVNVGRTKSIGVCNFNESQIQRLIDNSRIPPSNIQFEMHVNFQQKPLVEFCQKNNIVVTSFSTLGAPGSKMKFQKPILTVLENPTLIEMAEKYEKSPAQIALRFVMQLGVVVIPKSIKEKRIEENFQVLNFNINDEDFEALKAADRGEEGRVVLFDEIFPGVVEHPEFPYNI